MIKRNDQQNIHPSTKFTEGLPGIQTGVNQTAHCCHDEQVN